MRSVMGIAIVVLLALAGGYWYYTSLNIDVARNDTPPAGSLVPQAGHEELPPEPATVSQGASIGEENAVDFQCADGKSMTAVFARDIVGITLSDGRQITLRQASSGSGIRYLNNTETIEFRGQGQEGFLIEAGETTYAECVANE